MSLKYKVVLVWVICLSYKVAMTGCEVVLVNRNIIDSFRVGKDGCTNNPSVCITSSTCQPSSGLCLCSDSEPNFRNPATRSSSAAYGCIKSYSIRVGFGGTDFCTFEPFQVIPYSHEDPVTQFSQNDALQSCFLRKARAKFPDNATEMELQWLTGSYVDLTVFNKTLHFKWKISVPDLQGTIITLSFRCISGSDYKTKCLRAKVFGTWSAEAVSEKTEPTALSTVLKSSQITSKTTSPVTVTTVTTETVKTAKQKSTASGCSDEESSDSNKVFIVLFAIALAVIVVLGIVVGFLWKKLQRIQSKNSNLSREMQNIDEEERTNSGNEVSSYEVPINIGIHNHGASFPSSGHNNNGGLSDHNYEEPSNYQALNRNHLQDLSDEHNYQSLTTSQKIMK